MDENRKPQAGDAVILTNVWPWAGDTIKVGSIGIIDGVVGFPSDHLQVTWHFSQFRGYDCCGSPKTGRFGHEKYLTEENPHEYVSCSGGPGTIALPANLLKPTDKMVNVRAWCWRDLPKADGGVHYDLDVPLWEWNGKEYN